MWEFRRHWRDLKPAEQEALESLFEILPELGVVYHLREQLTEIFDTAADRTTAAERIEQWRAEAQESEQDWSGFLDLYDRHRDGILAYFDEGKTSGVVEGLNNKARVIIKRCYGLKSAGTLWTRLVLDVNRAAQRLGRSIQALRQLAHGIRAAFCGLYT
jgi:transposase